MIISVRLARSVDDDSRPMRRESERRWLTWTGIFVFTREQQKPRRGARTEVGTWIIRFVERNSSSDVAMELLRRYPGLASLSRGSRLGSHSSTRRRCWASIRSEQGTQVYPRAGSRQRHQQRLPNLPREVREQVARHGARMGLAGRCPRGQPSVPCVVPR